MEEERADLLRRSSVAEREMSASKFAFEEDLAAMTSRVSALQEQLAFANKERARSSEKLKWRGCRGRGWP